MADPTDRANYDAGRGPHFSQIPVKLQKDPDADVYAISVYAAIFAEIFLRYDRTAEVPDAQLARLAKCSDRQVRRTRDWLRERGWLTWSSEPGKPNRYELNMTPDSQSGVGTPDSQTAVSQAGPPDSQAGPPDSQAGVDNPDGIDRARGSKNKKKKKDVASLEQQPATASAGTNRTTPDMPTIQWGDAPLTGLWTEMWKLAAQHLERRLRIVLPRGLTVDVFAGDDQSPRSVVIWRDYSILQAAKKKNFRKTHEKFQHELRVFWQHVFGANGEERSEWGVWPAPHYPALAEKWVYEPVTQETML